MVQPRYVGVDRQNRPFVMTADSARQMFPDNNDMIGLEGPKADLTTANGGWNEVTGFTGTYQPQPQIMEMFGDVTLFTDRGDEFHTDTAHIDLATNITQGHDPVNGQGPFGHIESQGGFRSQDRGATIFFFGHTNLWLAPHSPPPGQQQEQPPQKATP
jgi:lipopolysaccharide export system protein LptC